MSVKGVTLGSCIPAIQTFNQRSMHIVGTHASFVGIPTLRNAVSDETLTCGPQIVYPFERLRKGVDQWTFLFVCVWLGHRKMENQTWAQVLTRFHPLGTEWDIRTLSLVSFLKRQRMHVCEGLTLGSWILAIQTFNQRSMHIVGTHVSFIGISTLRNAVLDETLTRGPQIVYPFERLRKRVDHWTFLFVCVWLGHRNM